MRGMQLGKQIVKRRRRPGELVTPRTAIRNHCLECVGYDASEVRRCTAPECWLWPFRLGRQGDLDRSDAGMSAPGPSGRSRRRQTGAGQGEVPSGLCASPTTGIGALEQEAE